MSIEPVEQWSRDDPNWWKKNASGKNARPVCGYWKDGKSARCYMMGEITVLRATIDGGQWHKLLAFLLICNRETETAQPARRNDRGKRERKTEINITSVCVCKYFVGERVDVLPMMRVNMLTARTCAYAVFTLLRQRLPALRTGPSVRVKVAKSNNCQSVALVLSKWVCNLIGRCGGAGRANWGRYVLLILSLYMRSQSGLLTWVNLLL